jgi:integrase
MLITCPECQLPVSDKAFSCPHCGLPLKEKSSNNRARSQNKRRRLPNGFGQITELKNANLKKRYRAMITIGVNDEGRPISKILKPTGYFETYNEAYSALVEYNKHPFDYVNTMTVEELFKRWSAAYYPTVSAATKTSNELAWKYCSAVKDLDVHELRTRHIKFCMNEGVANINSRRQTAPLSVKTLIKIMFDKMLDYAVEYEILDRNCSRTFSISKEDKKAAVTNRKHHIPYTDKEIQLLWENINNYEWVDAILIQCYSGWRPKELELLEIANINLDEHTMSGGVKTVSGKNRVVPIHSKIYDLVKNRYDQAVLSGSKYLFCAKPQKGTNWKFTNSRYCICLEMLKKDLGFNEAHAPHDGRAHFITMAKKYKVDEYAIKRIVGHKIDDITEETYTTRSFDWLREEIERIE